MGELRFAHRRLRAAPWFSLAATATVAITIALGTTVFAAVEGVFFRTLPYERPQELYRVSLGYSDDVLSRPGVAVRNRSGLLLSMPDVRDLEAAAPGARFVALQPGFRTRSSLQSEWTPVVARVGEGFFDVLGQQPMVGGFRRSDFEPTQDPLVPVVVSYGTWQTQLGGRMDAIGQVLSPDSATRYSVVGILPADFVYPEYGGAPDLLRPLTIPAGNQSLRAARTYNVIARLPHRVPFDQYEHRFNLVAKSAALELGNTGENGGAGPADVVALERLQEYLGANERARSRTVLAVSLGLILLGCINLSGLVASRMIARGRELAVRRALGAGLRQVVTTIAAETVIVVCVGAVVGAALSAVTWPLVVRRLPFALSVGEVTPSRWRIAAFVVVASTVSALLVSSWACLRSLRGSAAESLAHGGLTSTPAASRGRSVVITAQVALGLVLTLCGAMVVGSLWLGASRRLGFDPQNLVLVRGGILEVPPPSNASQQQLRAHQDMLQPARTAILDRAMERLRSFPGVTAVGATDGPILAGGTPGGMFRGDSYAITQGFIEAMGLRLREGRWPTPEELESGVAVAVVSEQAAMREFQGRSPVGKLLRSPGQSDLAVTVVGVVDRARLAAWDESNPGNQFYVPYRSMSRRSSFSIVLRTRENPRVLADLIRRDPILAESDVVYTSAALVEDLLAEDIRPRVLQAWLFGTFSTSALVIVGVGVFGLVAAVTSRREREVAIRLTMGATSARVVALMLREQLLPVLAGLLIGSAGSFALYRYIRGYVYGIAMFEPSVWITSVLAMIAVAGTAVFAPAVRASLVHPATALRTE